MKMNRDIDVRKSVHASPVWPPGGILVTQTVRDLVAGSGLAFDDHGVRHLKGVPEEWRVFSVR